jgi:hypothetical protein
VNAQLKILAKQSLVVVQIPLSRMMLMGVGIELPNFTPV